MTRDEWDALTVGRVREILNERWTDKDGIECPCCTQKVKLYPRPLGSKTGRILCAMSRPENQDDDGWVDVPALSVKLTTKRTRSTGGDEAKARYWGLIEPMPDVREDGSWRTGWWRLTPKGHDFINERIVIERHANVFNAICWGMSTKKGWVSIRDVLGKKFDLDLLLRGEL